MEYNWSGKRLLIVEDTYLNYMLLETILNPTKVNISIADSSGSFFNIIDEGFDIILMDINLSEKITGIDLMKYMKRNDINIPVIIQTAYDENFINLNDIKYEYIARKPINAKKLMKEINNVFKKYKKLN